MKTLNLRSCVDGCSDILESLLVQPAVALGHEQRDHLSMYVTSSSESPASLRPRERVRILKLKDLLCAWSQTCSLMLIRSTSHCPGTQAERPTCDVSHLAENLLHVDYVFRGRRTPF